MTWFELMSEGSIRLVYAHASQQIYTRVTNPWTLIFHAGKANYYFFMIKELGPLLYCASYILFLMCPYGFFFSFFFFFFRLPLSLWLKLLMHHYLGLCYVINTRINVHSLSFCLCLLKDDKSKRLLFVLYSRYDALLLQNTNFEHLCSCDNF
jgi:hypothetical protein